MRKTLGTAIRMLIIMTVLTGVIYPLVVTGLGRALFPFQAGGSVIDRNGRAAGSLLIGQNFSKAGYFRGRPSATTPFPYNPASSAGSNLGPNDPALLKAVSERVRELRAADPGNAGPIPVDLVTSSGSGLDPHISPAAAEYQVGRVARERGMSRADVRALVAAHTKPRFLGVWGEPRVNVLELNQALDEAKKMTLHELTSADPPQGDWRQRAPAREGD